MLLHRRASVQAHLSVFAANSSQLRSFGAAFSAGLLNHAIHFDLRGHIGRWRWSIRCAIAADRYATAVSDLYSAPPYEPSWEELTQVPVTLNANDWSALGSEATRGAVPPLGGASYGDLLRVRWPARCCIRQRQRTTVYALDRDALSLAPLAQRHQ